MIKLQNVSKNFAKTFILKDLNGTIKDECIYGLIGANGAGKSTLLRLISSIYSLDEGSITLDKEDVYDNPSLKQKIVFVPDELYFYPNYTLKDMANFRKALYPSFSTTDLESMAKILKLPLDRSLETFSKGERRQSAIILALATHAKYYLFDETFDGIDPVVRKTIKKMMAREMCDYHSTMLITSHNLRELEDICDYLGVLYEGKILFESEIDELKATRYKVQLSFNEPKTKKDFANLDIVSYEHKGKIDTLVLRGQEKDITKTLEKMHPVLMEYVPLTLEEIFIYEMEDLGYVFME